MVNLEDTIYLHFGTTSAATGAATNADSTPTVTVEEDGVAMAYSPTVANVTTGLYRVTIVASTANGFEVGKRYSVYVVATVGAITGRDGIGEFEVRQEPVYPTGAVASDGGNTALTFKTDLASSTTDFYSDCLLIFLTGSLALGAPKKVTGYNGSTKFITVKDGYTSTPSAGDTFILVNR